MNNIIPYSPHLAVHLDYSSVKPLSTKEILPDGSALYPVVLSYTGIRTYLINGVEVRVLRRPEQVFSESHKRTLRMLTMTSYHPKEELDKKVLPVWLNIYGKGEVDEYGVVHLPPSNFYIGQTGDSVWAEIIHGYTYPMGYVSIKDEQEAKNGVSQTSLGYFSLRMPPPPEEMVDGVGIWNGPFGPEPYQLEQVLDLNDPRLQVSFLVEAGIAKHEEDALKIRARIGANHIAKLPEGRGGPDVKIEMDEKPKSVTDLFSGYQDNYKGVYVCFDTDVYQKRLDTVELIINNERELSLITTMRHTLTDLLPRVTHILDEIGVAEMPKKEMDVSPEIMEALKQAQNAINASFEELMSKLANAENGMKSAEEKAHTLAEQAVGTEKKAEQLAQEKAALASQLDVLKAERDQAWEELAPIRRERIQKQIEEALKVGAIDVSKASTFDSVEEARRAVVYARVPTLKDKECSKDYIEARFHALQESFRESLDVNKTSPKTEKFFGQHQDESPKNAFTKVDVGKFELEQIYQAVH